MEVAYFVLGLVAILGTYSIYSNGKKNKIIDEIIQRFLEQEQGTLVSVEKPNLSGPFNDEFYDAQKDNLYQNLGIRRNETAYRKIHYTTAAQSQPQEAWVQIRLERLKPSYIEWKA